MKLHSCSRWRAAALALLVSCALSACGGSDDDDSSAASALSARIAAIGYAGPDASGDVAVDVRSQSELILTGSLSVEGGQPILSYLWEPQNDAARAAALTVRDNKSIAVTVPALRQPADLVFQLTVRDSAGKSDSAVATLHVRPVIDAGALLELIGEQAGIRVIVATKNAMPSGGAFSLSMISRTTYTTLAGTRNTIEEALGGPITGVWLAGLGSGGDSVSDYRNPAFERRLPAVNQGEITRAFQKDQFLAARMSPDPAFIDDADMTVAITLDVPDAQSEGVLYVLDAAGRVVARAENARTGLPTVLTLAPEQVENLRISGGGLENKATAQAYYSAIDPGGAKTTLRDWLIGNCFDPDATEYGADAHAVYTNNYDLGFGRDMYVKDSRPGNCASPSFRSGDAAAVVLNYASLEAAAKKIGAFLAVAMEYKASGVIGQPGLVTFYAFAPEARTGQFRRVSSADFDGRGQKFIPGACTMCHGGRPVSVATDPSKTYEASANVGATFMPWDLESLLYSDTDLSFSREPADASLRGRYTRAAQEAQFRKLNAFVHATYGEGSPFRCYDQFGGPCELIEMWYGGAGLPSATFLNGQVASRWQAGIDGNPADAERIYREVFARHCRACHVQRVFRAGSAKDPQFLSYGEFIRTQTPAWRDRIVDNVFRNGTMPAARLTMDRFWTGLDGAASAAELLARHLDVPAQAVPGQPIACVASEQGPTLSADGAARTVLQRNAVVSLSADCSNFAGKLEWSLSGPPGSRVRLVGNGSSHAAFVPDVAGPYDVSLRVTDEEGEAQSSLNRFAIVENKVPRAANLAVTVDLNRTMTVDVLAQSTSLGDAPATLRAPVLVSGSGVSAVINAQSRILVTATSAAGGEMRYAIVDSDGEASFGSITVTVAASLAANDLTVPAVEAYGAQVSRPTYELDLAEVVAAQGQPVTFFIEAGPTLAGRRDGSTGTVTLDNCSENNSRTCALYSPPQAAASVFGGTVLGPNDTFTYRACLTDQPATCDTGTITVPLKARASFTPIANTMRQTCASGTCHLGAQEGANWLLAPTPQSDEAAYCAIRDKLGIAPESEDEGVPIVNVHSPMDSLLFVKPQGLRNHGGGNVLGQWNPDGASDPALIAIRDWLYEGAYFTGAGADHNCQP